MNDRGITEGGEMNGELRLSLTASEERAVSELIRLCNEADNTSYDTAAEWDFCYLYENPGEAESGVREPLLSVLFGYRIGEREQGREVLELSAFTHPRLRRQGLLRGSLNALQDDFRNFSWHFVLKPLRTAEGVREGRLPESAEKTVRALSFRRLHDELFLRKTLTRGIANPRDSLSNRYGELHFTPYHTDTLYLYGLLVYDRYLGQGHGRALMEAAEHFESGPYRQILLQVSSRNEIACGLYASLGYEVVDRSMVYAFSCKERS